MFRRGSALCLCQTKPPFSSTPWASSGAPQAAKNMTGMALFSGSAPQRMVRSARAKEASAASKKASGLFDGGDMQGAAIEWRKAVDSLRSKECGLGEDVSVLEPLNNLACAIGELGRGTEKLALLKEHAELVAKIYGAQHPQVVVCRYNLAAAMGDVGRPKEMLRKMEAVLEMQRGILPPERRAKHAKIARVLLGCADAHGRCGDHVSRLAALSEAMPMVVHHCGAEHPQVASVYLALCDNMLEFWASLRRRQGGAAAESVEGRTTAAAAAAELNHRDDSNAATSTSASARKHDPADESSDPLLLANSVVAGASAPATSHEAAKSALRFARGAFKIEEKVIPPTSSHLLTHSRLALLRSRAALSPNMTFQSFAPFLGDIRADVVRHTSDTGKLLIPVFAFAAQDALTRAVAQHAKKKACSAAATTATSERPVPELCQAAKEMGDLAFQVSLRHFDAEGHIETPRRLVEQAAVELGSAVLMRQHQQSDSSSSSSSSTSDNENDVKGSLEKVERCCREAVRRLDKMGAESDFTYRLGADALQKEAAMLMSTLSASSSSAEAGESVLDTVRSILKF